jgi:hypothetical protein
MPVPPLLAAAALFVAAAALLLLHHGWTHGHEDPDTSAAQRESCLAACYFQPSDVGNCRTCNHETWILASLALGAGCVAAHFLAPA